METDKGYLRASAPRRQKGPLLPVHKRGRDSPLGREHRFDVGAVNLSVAVERRRLLGLFWEEVRGDWDEEVL